MNYKMIFTGYKASKLNPDMTVLIKCHYPDEVSAQCSRLFRAVSAPAPDERYIDTLTRIIWGE